MNVIILGKGKQMSEREILVAESRSVAEEKAKQLRRQGWIPAVVYGQGENQHVKIENLALSRVLRTAGMTNLIELSVEDSKLTVLAKDIQSHPTRGELIHVDFYEVNMLETIIVEAALIMVGIAAPEADGLGAATLTTHAVEIECLPDNLLSEIEVDMTLIISPEDVITIGDLDVSEDVTILSSSNTVIAAFEFMREEQEEEEEEEELFITPSADEVEVISKGKQEEEFEE